MHIEASGRLHTYHRTWGYGIAILATALITAFLKALSPIFGEIPALSPLLIGVGWATWQGGLSAGLTATALSTLASAYFLTEPFDALEIAYSHEQLRVAFLLLVGVLLSLLLSSLIGAERKAFRELLERKAELSAEIAERKTVQATLAQKVKELEAILAVAPISLLIADDPECRHMRMNAAFAQLVDKPLTSNPSLTAPPEERPAWKVFRAGKEVSPEALPIQRAAADGNCCAGESYTLVTESGKRVELQCYAAPLLDAHGRSYGAVGAFLDITQLIRQQQELDRRLAEIEAIYDTAPVGLCVLDSECRYLRINQRLAELNGAPVADHLGRVVAEVVPDFADIAASLVSQVITSGKPARDLELSGFTPRYPGVPRLYLTHICPLKHDGIPYAVNVTVEDITDQKQLEDHLKTLNDALALADRQKDEFLATLAHELLNPLAPIRNAVHVLQKFYREDPEPRERNLALLAMLERQINHLVRLVDDLLQISRISRGKISLQAKPVDLNTIVQDAVETSQPFIEANRHSIRVQLPPEPLPVNGDSVRLVQVFSNLLNNASKYMEPGGIIQVRAERSEHEARVSVRDEGIGIPAEMLPHVFDLFMQADRTTRRSQGGLGIGLALVQKLVAMHGGRVEARSEGPGQGSELIVHLPLLPALSAEARPAALSKPPTMTGRRILIVDDNRDAADSLATILEAKGAKVEVVYDGTATLDMCRRFRPEIVLLDLGMPGMDGCEVARRIREQPEGRDIKLVALTAWGHDDDRKLTREAGFDHHLLKPADPERLEMLLEALMD